MRPVRFLQPLSLWIMRLGWALYAFTRYWDIFLLFNFKSVMFYVSSLTILFAGLLVIGGFLKKHTLTVLSGLILTLVTGYQAVINLDNGVDFNFSVFVICGAVAVFFLAFGNKK